LGVGGWGLGVGGWGLGVGGFFLFLTRERDQEFLIGFQAFPDYGIFGNDIIHLNPV